MTSDGGIRRMSTTPWPNFNELAEKSRWIRREVLRRTFRAGRGHLGGTFSCVDILVALYYGGVLRVDPKRPKWEDRDRLFLGKGHASLALYRILTDLGFFNSAILDQFGADGSALGNQLSIETPGVEYNTGSMGHALGVGAGVALAGKLRKRNYRVFVLLGDGECAEGSVWESMMFASHQKLNNLIGIVDRNRLSVTNVIGEDDPAGRLDDKARACGWRCSVIDGHSFEQILGSLGDLERADSPVMVIADTIKGKGVSFMEQGLRWHHEVPTKEEYELAMRELGGS